jgi:GNAT superfamily N-acetyltransferase
MEVNYSITDSITPEEYMKLREVVGWGLFPLEEAQAGLSNSYIWCLRDNDASGQPIGIGRVIWDHGYVMYIADIIVIPEYQGNGLGRVIMEQVMDFIHEQLKPGYKFMVSLCSAKRKEEFYKKFGFIVRPNDDVGSGMHQWFVNE